MAPAALKLSGLTKTYERVHLARKEVARGVEGINLEVNAGEVFGLLGLNGSGKTTAIKLILGLLFPTAGTVDVFGRPPGDPDVQSRMGFLPEIPSFFHNLTVTEFLQMCGTASGLSPAQISTALPSVLDSVQLTGNEKKFIRELSKGMTQRIGLAQAMIHDPDLLILDEPVTGLDPLGVHQTRLLIANWAQKGKTIFFSSHSISELALLAHRVGIMNDGRLVRLVNRNEWEPESGRLEKLFLDTLQKEGVRF